MLLRTARHSGTQARDRVSFRMLMIRMASVFGAFALLTSGQDPPRAEVPAAVAACKRAGVVVRVVTGDSVLQ